MLFGLQGLVDLAIDDSVLRKFGMLIRNFADKPVVPYSRRDLLNLPLLSVESFENRFDVWGNDLVIGVRKDALNLVIQELRLIGIVIIIVAIGSPNSSQILT